MPPCEALELPLRVEQLRVEVDVLPAQAQGFALSESHADADHPSHEPGALRCGQKERFRFVHRERIRLGLVDRWRVHECGDVLHDHSAPVGNLQGARQDAVHLQYVRGGVAWLSSIARYIRSRCSGCNLSIRCFPTPGMMSLRVFDQ